VSDVALPLPSLLGRCLLLPKLCASETASEPNIATRNSGPNRGTPSATESAQGSNMLFVSCEAK
jgi:hypothetical protein